MCGSRGSGSGFVCGRVRGSGSVCGGRGRHWEFVSGREEYCAKGSARRLVVGVVLGSGRVRYCDGVAERTCCVLGGWVEEVLSHCCVWFV